MKNLRWSCSMPFDSKHRHHVFLSEVQEKPTDKAKVGKRGNVSITPVTNFVHLPCIIWWWRACWESRYRWRPCQKSFLSAKEICLHILVRYLDISLKSRVSSLKLFGEVCHKVKEVCVSLLLGHFGVTSHPDIYWYFHLTDHRSQATKWSRGINSQAIPWMDLWIRQLIQRKECNTENYLAQWNCKQVHVRKSNMMEWVVPKHIKYVSMYVWILKYHMKYTTAE